MRRWRWISRSCVRDNPGLRIGSGGGDRRSFPAGGFLFFLSTVLIAPPGRLRAIDPGRLEMDPPRVKVERRLRDRFGQRRVGVDGLEQVLDRRLEP